MNRLENRQEMDFKVSAILPAAGCGVRMGAPTPKQFCNILGKPLISYTLGVFERVSWIDETVVVVSPDKEDFLHQIVSQFNHKKVRVVVGGSARHRSIYNGVKALCEVDSSLPDVVIIHDAVRPFVEEKTLREVAQAARQNGAAGAVRHLVSTIIAADVHGVLDHSLDRNKYRASEMPQAFHYRIIKEAYEKCTDYDLDHGTECLHLALKYAGVRARLVEGPDCLWKVTHKKDLLTAKAILHGTSNTVCLSRFPNDHIRKLLTASFESKSLQVLCADASGDLDTTANNFVIHHSTRQDRITLENVCKNAKEKLLWSQTGGTILPIITSEVNDEDKSYLEDFRNFIRTLGINAENICINGIWVEDQSRMATVGEMAASIVFDRNLLYTGQTFVL